MSRKAVWALATAVLLAAGGLQAWAETTAPPESVTVTGTKLREEFHKFLRGFVAPSKATGKLARWERHICPLVVGQNTHFAAFITQRIKFVALAAGAPVSAEASCAPNIEVVFTTTPQALLDNVRKHDVFFLGYAESNAQLDKLATVTRPVQAWYMTESEDANGHRFVDSDIISAANDGALFEPVHYAAGSSRINDGIKTGFNHILTVVDSTKLAGQNLVPLADYISMLALTQINSLDACQQLTSVVNILAADCDHSGTGLTRYDMAYLQGLYKMSAGRGVMFQRNDIAAMMADALMPKQ